MMTLLDALLPDVDASEAQPATLLFWTWIGSVIGNLFWFGSAGVAVAGGVALGLVAVPYAWTLWQSRP
jgi:putative membrane protein